MGVQFRLKQSQISDFEKNATSPRCDQLEQILGPKRTNESRKFLKSTTYGTYLYEYIYNMDLSYLCLYQYVRTYARKYLKNKNKKYGT